MLPRSTRAKGIIMISLIILSATSGCLNYGKNPNLLIQNELSSPVELEVTVVQDVPPEKRGRIWYNDTVGIASKSERSLEIFTGSRIQYLVNASVENQNITFKTRPICSNSKTWITVTSSKTLRSYVEWCDGTTTTKNQSITSG